MGVRLGDAWRGGGSSAGAVAASTICVHTAGWRWLPRPAGQDCVTASVGVCVRIVWRAPRAARLFLYDFKAPRSTHVTFTSRILVLAYFDKEIPPRLARYPALLLPPIFRRPAPAPVVLPPSLPTLQGDP